MKKTHKIEDNFDDLSRVQQKKVLRLYQDLHGYLEQSKNLERPSDRQEKGALSHLVQEPLK